MNFPFYILEPGQDPLGLDPGNFYYFLAQGGVYQVRRTPFYTSVTPAQNPILPNLPKITPNLDLQVANIPANLLSRAGSFFRWAHLTKKAEAIVLLFLNQETGEWSIDAPSQTVPITKYGGSWLALDYDPGSCQRPLGSLAYGTIHSHCDGTAFHSSTDEHDEKYGDGLHITFGRIMSPVPDLAATFVSNTVRFKYEPSEVLEPFEIAPNTHPIEWQHRHRRRVVKYEADAWKGGIYGY